MDRAPEGALRSADGVKCDHQDGVGWPRNHQNYRPMKSVFGSDRALIILVVLAFDDERYDYPDRLHSFLLLYRYGAAPLFLPVQ